MCDGRGESPKMSEPPNEAEEAQQKMPLLRQIAFFQQRENRNLFF